MIASKLDETSTFLRLQLRVVKQMAIANFHLSDMGMEMFYGC